MSEEYPYSDLLDWKTQNSSSGKEDLWWPSWINYIVGYLDCISVFSVMADIEDDIMLKLRIDIT